MNAKKLFIFTSLVLLSDLMAQELGEWTILVYMRSTSELSDMAFKNINDMLSTHLPEKTSLFLQLHAYGDTALRYKVEPGILRQQGTVQLTGNDAYDLPDAFTHAYTQAPARHYMLILWGSGFGILDPVWDREKQQWKPEQNDSDTSSCSCDLPVGVEKRYLSMKNHLRGILLSKDPIMYTPNDDFVAALQEITTILGKQSIDILGLDMCLGSMIEIAYQSASRAQYLIGSQNCELKDGWDYTKLGEALCNESVEDVACFLACAFETYYEPRAAQGTYTQSVIRLSGMPQFKSAIDKVVGSIDECHAFYGEQFKELLIKARERSSRFCFMPTYTDLVDLCEKIKEEIQVLPQSMNVANLISNLSTLQSLVREAVVMNVTGYKMKRIAHGLSIYFPSTYIDSSYNNQFTKDSRWREFLEYVIH